ncbi:DUF3037 domain-containing protein [Halomonas sp. PR-M31]|uniref:DUF3037 domain-containing protein n=1 Tax=Halomonas sp. PR-M31 TaxID=1471202 RepID=UPI0006514000|nr:DUF3037 domain-containing protein [Halomonas sp. PR-M31]
MSAICNYAILRFQPYADTGEFANIGVVMLCNDGQFLYRLETRHYKRVTQFFGIQRSLLGDVRKAFEQELKRIAALMKENTEKRDVQLSVFKHLIRPSETILRFSHPGTIAADAPSEAIDKLFMAYVHHEFGKQYNEEAEMTKQVSKWLKHIKDRSYAEHILGNELHQVKFPLVWQEDGVARQAVKPISFDLEDASKIIEKGDKWEARMRRLKESGNAPADTVFVAHEPDSKDDFSRQRAYREVQRELVERGLIRIIPDTLGRDNILRAIAEPQSLH